MDPDAKGEFAIARGLPLAPDQGPEALELVPHHGLGLP
jgi:hypothetical protein